MLLSIIIPAYNEEKRILNTLKDINRYLSGQNYSYEIIVVNDGSKDKTAEIVRSLIEVISSLKLIDNKINRGKGAAVKQGMLEAKGDYRLFLDADNAIKIDHLDDFWIHIKKSSNDIIIGSIEIKGSKREQRYNGSERFYRHILGKLSKILVRVLTIWSIHDTQRAFKLFKAEQAKEIFLRQTTLGWGFDIEILVIAKKLGYKIKELPVTWINPPSQRISLRSYSNTLRELLTIKFNSLGNKYK